MISFIVFSIIMVSVRLYRSLPPENLVNKRLLVSFGGGYLIYFINIQFIEARFFIFANCVFYMLSMIIVGREQRSRFDSVEYKRSFLGEEEV